MPRVFNQKIKILYLMRIFLEQTDEEHPMSVKELISYLNSLGISAERKTVYDDIETLRNFGMDILNRREHPAGFYLASREFDSKVDPADFLHCTAHCSCRRCSDQESFLQSPVRS